ncbi:MAG: 4'-phosphopantetheinyl transferase superfamily protein [Myxococcales bacterium]
MESVLDSQERETGAARRVERDRKAYAAAHVLLRRALSQAAGGGIAPCDWRFVYYANGRPSVAPPLERLGLAFSLTHTDGLVACAITLRRDVGIDAEDLNREIRDPSGIWKTCFGPSEAGLLRPREWLAAFCLKEAYAKARGLGLALDFRSFAVSLQPPALAATDEGDPRCWKLELLPAGEFALAVAGRLRSSIEALRIRRMPGLL